MTTTSKPRSSWHPVDLSAVVDGIQSGKIVGPVPSLLTRTDGVSLIYPGLLHSLAGEPESGKGWLVLSEAVQHIETNRRVLYLDFEDTALIIVGRLLALGATPDAIVSSFVYVDPADALHPGALDALLSTGPFALGVIDGLSEAYSLLGLDHNSNTDVPTFLRRLPRPIAARGIPTIQIDHVVKAKESRSRYALGGQHKLAGVAVAYGVEVIDRPSRRHTGKVKLILNKDRHGHIPGQIGSAVAIATIEPENDGARVTVTINPPDSTSENGNFRPTVLMERISRTLEETPSLTKRSIIATVKGNRDWLDTALEHLIAEGYVSVKVNGQAHEHTADRPFRDEDETDRAPVPQPCPNRAPGTPSPHRAHVPPPTRGGTHTGHNGDSPDRTDEELEALIATFPGGDN